LGLGGQVGISDGKPNVSISPSIGRSANRDQIDFLASRKGPTYLKSGVQIHYEYKGREKNQVCETKHIFVFELAEPFISNQDMRLDSLLMMCYPGNLLTKHTPLKYTPLKPLIIPSISSFGLIWNQYPATGNKVTIAGLIGEPKVGKTTFIGSLFNSFFNNLLDVPADTPYVMRHNFYNVTLNTKQINFSFLDTRGYFLDANDFNDAILFDRFVRGLPTETPFKRGESLEKVPLNSNNAPSHILILFNGWSLWKGLNIPAPNWFSTIGRYAGKTLEERLKDIGKLYKTAVETLARIRYPNNYGTGNLNAARDSTYVLITHMDMVKDKEEAKAALKEGLRKSGVHHERVLFAETNCTWREEDLKNYEGELTGLLQQLHKTDDWETAAEEFYHKGVMHIKPDICTDPHCEHKYTDKTLAEFRAMLDYIVSHTLY
jgi:hypothetical protein